jgi:hypothetical protein
MKTSRALLFSMAALAVAIVPADLFYASRFVPRFKALEKERIVTSNQLATAKIVSENLDHVRELVFRNMDFPGQKDTIPQESVLFEFLTTCVNDLKMKVVSVRPMRPTSSGRVTTYGYDIQLEGDFFSLGELCAKLENSQRVMALTSIEVARMGGQAGSTDRRNGAPSAKGGVIIRMHLDTFRVRKG